MDMLFIPGWLIFAIVAAIVLIILLAKAMSMLSQMK